jgi:hypothetical protein
MNDRIPYTGDDPGQFVVRVAGVAMLAAGVGALTGVGLPTAGGVLGRLVAAFAVVRGALVSYFAPHPAALVEFVAGLTPEQIG